MEQNDFRKTYKSVSNLPIFSIIIPIFNAATTLDYCIDSIIKQTFNNYEIILVNDGSTDKSETLCRNIIKKYNNYRICFVNKKNGGVSSARNAGLEIAKGEYIVFIDPDDYISNDYLSVIYNAFSEGYDLVAFGLVRETPNQAPLKFNFCPGLYEIYNPTDMIINHFLNRDFGWNVTRAFKRDIIDKFNIRFDPNIFFGEDLCFSLTYCSHINKIIYVPNCIYHYCYRDNSACKTINLTKVIDQAIKISKNLLQHFKSNVDNNQLYKHFPIIHATVVKLLVEDNYSFRRNGFRYLKKYIKENASDAEFFYKYINLFLKNKKSYLRIAASPDSLKQIAIFQYISHGNIIRLGFKLILYKKLKLQNFLFRVIKKIIS